MLSQFINVIKANFLSNNSFLIQLKLNVCNMHTNSFNLKEFNIADQQSINLH